MEIWADMFPRCSRILYYAQDGAGVGGPAMLNVEPFSLGGNNTFSVWALDIDNISRRLGLRHTTNKVFIVMVG